MTQDLAESRPTSAAPTAPSPRALLTTAFVVLIVALVARQVFAFWEHYDGSATYEELAAFGEAYWPMNVLVFGPSFAIGFAAQALLVWQLGRGRGRIVTYVGAALLLVGGTVFALVATAHALPFDWAANHGILDESAGREVVGAFTDRGTPVLVPYIIGSQAVIALGALVSIVGARASLTVPTWMLVTTVALVLVFAVVPIDPGSPLEVGFSIAQVAVWGVLGWFGWRAGTAR